MTGSEEDGRWAEGLSLDVQREAATRLYRGWEEGLC